MQCIRGITLCSVFFCPSEPTGATQEGVNTGTQRYHLLAYAQSGCLGAILTHVLAIAAVGEIIGSVALLVNGAQQ